MPIRAALTSKGYGEEDHAEGWALLHAASGYTPARPFDGVDAGVRDAIRALDAWDEDGFRIVAASLERRFPEIAAQVLDGIGPSTGPAAVVGVKTLLDRLEVLEKTKSKDAHAALALLAKRGLDKEERGRLAALVETAQSVSTIGQDTEAGAEAAQTEAAAKHVAALSALRGWYDEWSTIARATVKRRDYLILLGMAKRKAPQVAATAGKGSGAGTAAKTAPTSPTAATN